MANVQVQVLGDRQVRRKLERLGKKAPKIGRKAVNEGLKPIYAAMRGHARKSADTKALYKSIARKVTTKRGLVDGRVGPRTDYAVSAASGKRIKGRRVGRKFQAEEPVKGKVRRPQTYSHIVERGSRHSAAQPFARPAYDEHGGTARRIVQESLAAQIAAEAQS